MISDDILKDLEKSMNNDDFIKFVNDAMIIITDPSFMKDESFWIKKKEVK